MQGSHWFFSALLLPLVTYTSAIQQHQQHHGLDDFDDEDEPGNQLKKDDFVRNKEHIKEHLTQVLNFDPDTASKEELEFYFFQIHDFNKDKRLDGLELYGAVEHGLEDQRKRIGGLEIEDKDKEQRLKRLQQRLVSNVDMILRDADKDGDGYLSYSEYATSRRATRALNTDI